MMKNLYCLLVLLLMMIQPSFVLAAPPDLPENWLQMFRETIYPLRDPQKHICMMKQPNLPFKEMNCTVQVIYRGATASSLFYADDERYRPLTIGCSCINDNAPDYDYWLEALGKKSFEPVYQKDSIYGPHYRAYRYYMNDKLKMIPKKERYKGHRTWECFRQGKGAYHYCRVFDKNTNYRDDFLDNL